MKSTKKSLVASGLSLLCCGALLAGTTFAWFTDSATNTGNRIESGNLEIDLLMDLDGKGDSYTYTSIADGQGDIFSTSSNGFNWEPGRTEIVYLAVQNKGTLAASFDLDVIPTAVEDKTYLGDVLELAVLDDMKSSDVLTATNWKELTEDLEQGQNLFEKLNSTKTAVKDEIIEKGVTKYFALAVHMKETAEGEYENAAINIDVQVNATQAPVENDAFGNTYDEGAAEYAIYTDQDLKQALSKPVDGATYMVFADVEVPSNFTMSPARKGPSFTLDLNGHTVTLNGNTGCTVAKDATLTVIDSSKNGGGSMVHTGGNYMFAANKGISFTLTDEASLCESKGKGLTIA